ncbi:nicotinate-nucleotide--dimethylbenzimidazole phosphoribosyltransferase [Sporosarcina sp. GW1-11]|uniref:nicotinate-nucleotide--dimethylbenzimidazole phosphoribosyltransferase n=1 Tax=Sporosarcina sp. GW1-11 TaxID=2899126 RepID=UPI00294D0BF0|nr:nicotinate-nucleotide--dimethylbenzimidazole phosphoribosyltransferase [Sporosarcina sp. GW1-11]MDV6378028.1 nicotinate-nucleotide--dimethylbenzimidazole phosphoribosyltransferase [Sporosarcina sp. GW1-11]
MWKEGVFLSNYEIPALNKEAGIQAKEYLDTLTKPVGSLGRLEEIVVQLAEITGQRQPVMNQLGIIVFAADHGVVDEGISAFPQQVTRQMVDNMAQGGAAINVFGRQQLAKFSLVDVGVKGEEFSEPVKNRKVRQATKNFLQTEAMTQEEVEQALAIGYEEALAIFEEGVDCLVVGEVGIGNTTTSSAIVATVTELDPAGLVGYGTGISSEQHLHKIEVVRKALELHQIDREDGYDILRKVGGLEVAAMVGAMLAAASNRIPIVLDGFISTAAACVADKIAPGALHYMLLGHQSMEPGHQKAFEYLGKVPIVSLDMRLGEGTGAVVAYSIIQSAVRMVQEMATFESAGVSGKNE